MSIIAKVTVIFKSGQAATVGISHDSPLADMDDWPEIVIEGALGQRGHDFYKIDGGIAAINFRCADVSGVSIE